VHGHRDAVVKLHLPQVGEGEAPARALSRVRAQGPARASERAGLAGRLVLGLTAAGEDPARFGGYDYLGAIEARYNPVTGAYDSGLYANALAALGWLSARRALPAQALTHFRLSQCESGGYAHDERCLAGADIDTTALVLNVLVLAGVGPDDGARGRAVAFLRTRQNPDGGFGLDDQSRSTNANSTGLALSAIAALGGTPTEWRNEGRDPLRALRGLQLSSGAFAYARGDDRPNLYATVQAIPGLLGSAYPLRPQNVARASARADPFVATASRAPRAAPSAPVPERTVSRAGLVVQLGEGTTREFCIPFKEASISGAELLARSALPVVTQDFGGGNVFICDIGAGGRGGAGCVPRCPDAGACEFWGYYRMEAGARQWTFSERGAGSSTVRDGDIDGWRFARHGMAGGAPPRPATLADVCARPRPVAARVAGDAAPAPQSTPVAGFLALALAVATFAGWFLIRGRAGASRP
jgi:hypothetical protein